MTERQIVDGCLSRIYSELAFMENYIEQLSINDFIDLLRNVWVLNAKHLKYLESEIQKDQE